MTDPYQNYWMKRQSLAYYSAAKEFVQSFPVTSSILDVGGMDTPVPLWTGGMRVSLNLHPVSEDARWPEIRYEQGDFLKWDSEEKFDVVTCLQVLEHLDDDTVEPFARKLFDVAAKAVVISVPLEWKKGKCGHHKQDPVSEDDLKKWTGRDPDEKRVVSDNGLERIVCLYAAENTNN